MISNHQHFSGNDQGSSNRHHFLLWIMIIVFMVLGVRLWYLQVIKGSEHLGESVSNRTVVQEVVPVRGIITDRNGLVLMDNEPTFELAVQKSAIDDPEKLLPEVAALLGLPPEELLKTYVDLPGSLQEIQPLVTDLTRPQLVAVESHRHRLEGLTIKTRVNRVPLSDVLASHLLGYLGEISQNQLDNESRRLEEGVRGLVREGETREVAHEKIELEINPHKSGDMVGQSGVEQSMESYLQGRRGRTKQEIDSRGRWVRDIDRVKAIPGYTVRLTIDSRLQALGQALLGERAGAIVVMDPQTFEILALASSPTYSLSDFVGGISTQRWSSLQTDSFYPMANRAVSGQYPPGSTFKIVVALAALAEGLITVETEFYCSGTLKLGNHTFGCHNRSGHGKVDLGKSLQVSCDVYYYEIGRLLGVDRLAKKARELFGLGRRSGVELFVEQSGLIPDVAWKLDRYAQKWMPGETLPVSIGQGYVLCTPLQVAQFTAVVANGGTLYRPHLMKEILDVSGEVIEKTEPEIVTELNISPEFIEAVEAGLESVVGTINGTGRRAALPGIRVAGKTGTSQVVSKTIYDSFTKDNRPYKYEDHAWFTSYAPVEKPEVVVTVFLEHTGGGGTFAAPIAQQMLAAYFDTSIVASILPPPQIQPGSSTALELFGL